MNKIKPLPSVAYLQICFTYNPNSGDLTWRTRPLKHFANPRAWARYNTMYRGKPAGSINASGHRVVLLNQVPYLSHRIAWKLKTGAEPPASIDHINGHPRDNRWSNLRAATKLQQIGNQKLHRTNTSGYRGVSPHRDGKWIAVIGRKYLGLFKTPEEAADAYHIAAQEKFGEFYRKLQPLPNA